VSPFSWACVRATEPYDNLGRVFDHVTIRASDRAASERFYDLVLPTIELERRHSGEEYTLWTEFSLAQATDGAPVTRRLHVGFVVEAVHHDAVHTRGRIDHLWMRVADVAAAKRFYETVAPCTGFRLRVDEPTRASFRGAGAGFSLLAGRPTEHAHLAFPARENANVEAFHRAATEAGYRDNGPPGERPAYHAGY
jgi:catechol 2,3-dioxygenase-like lactoylglutathione lyase family enzyme